MIKKLKGKKLKGKKQNVNKNDNKLFIKLINLHFTFFI